MVLFRLIWCNYPTIINYQPGWVSRSGTKLFRWSSKATERLPLRQAALFQVCSSLSLGGFLQGGSSFMEVMQKWGGEPATKLMHLVLTPLSMTGCHVHIFNSSGCWYFSELSVENSGWLREWKMRANAAHKWPEEVVQALRHRKEPLLACSCNSANPLRQLLVFRKSPRRDVYWLPNNETESTPNISHWKTISWALKSQAPRGEKRKGAPFHRSEAALFSWVRYWRIVSMGLLLITLPMLARSSPCLFFLRNGSRPAAWITSVLDWKCIWPFSLMRNFCDDYEVNPFSIGKESPLGGQTVMNPWLSVGGVATSICRFCCFYF